MKRDFVYQITTKQEGLTILQFLQKEGYTHQTIVHLKKTPMGITRNGEWAYVNQQLASGDTLSIHLIEDECDTSILPVCLPFSILYEDEDLLVINKPADMPIHPSMKNHDNTLANALMFYFNEQKIPFTYRCINRLDRDTTGLTIVAKNMLSAGILSQMVSKREIHRTYLAICEGEISSSGCINAPIARVADSTIERCVNFTNGESALTHYSPIEYDSTRDLTLVQLKLETGRTHQIRVHMKHLGHPLIGDFLYNPNYTYMKRQALHSYTLSFVHPITKEKMHFTAPLFGDMKCLFPKI